MSIEDQGKTLYSWESPEFVVAKQDWRIDVVIVIVAVGLMGWAIWARQWTGVALVAMAAVAMYLLRTSRPRTFVHTITDKGIMVGDRFYPDNQIKSFWIVMEGSNRTLNLLPVKKFGLMLTLQLGDASIDKVRETLISRIPEDASRGEDTVDKVGRILKL